MANEQNPKYLENNDDFFSSVCDCYYDICVLETKFFYNAIFKNMELVLWKICFKRYKINLQEKQPNYTKDSQF